MALKKAAKGGWSQSSRESDVLPKRTQDWCCYSPLRMAKYGLARSLRPAAAPVLPD